MKVLLAGAAILLVAGCSTPAMDPTTEAPPTTAPTGTLAPSPTMEVPPMSPSGQLPASIMDPIVADAASRAGVDVEQVVVVRAEAVTWPDPGLGCPEPGMVYPQVLVDGYWVVVEASGMEYDYRGRRAGEFRLCEIPKPQRQQPVQGAGDS